MIIGETEIYEMVECPSKATDRTYLIRRCLYGGESSEGPIFVKADKTGWFTREEALEKISGLMDTTIKSHDFFTDERDKRAAENSRRRLVIDTIDYMAE